MKKIVLLLLCLVFTISACGGPNNLPDTESDIVSSNDNKSKITSSDDSVSDITSGTENATDVPTATEITDSRITTTETDKVFKEIGITLSVPADWKCLELGGEDGTYYHFQDPVLNEDCQLCFYITGAEYYNEQTEKDYSGYLALIHGDQVEIKTFAKEKLKGYDCTKVVSEYLSENERFVRIDYDYVVVGIRMYRFTVIYPASESEKYESVFESIIDSISFTELK